MKRCIKMYLLLDSCLTQFACQYPSDDKPAPTSKPLKRDWAWRSIDRQAQRLVWFSGSPDQSRFGLLSTIATMPPALSPTPTSYSVDVVAAVSSDKTVGNGNPGLNRPERSRSFVA